jgi:hypothetical protein
MNKIRVCLVVALAGFTEKPLQACTTPTTIYSLIKDIRATALVTPEAYAIALKRTAEIGEQAALCFSNATANPQTDTKHKKNRTRPNPVRS